MHCRLNGSYGGASKVRAKYKQQQVLTTRASMDEKVGHTVLVVSVVRRLRLTTAAAWRQRQRGGGSSSALLPPRTVIAACCHNSPSHRYCSCHNRRCSGACRAITATQAESPCPTKATRASGRFKVGKKE